MAAAVQTLEAPNNYKQATYRDEVPQRYKPAPNISLPSPDHYNTGNAYREAWAQAYPSASHTAPGPFDQSPAGYDYGAPEAPPATYMYRPPSDDYHGGHGYGAPPPLVENLTHTPPPSFDNEDAGHDDDEGSKSYQPRPLPPGPGSFQLTSNTSDLDGALTLRKPSRRRDPRDIDPSELIYLCNSRVCKKR